MGSSCLAVPLGTDALRTRRLGLVIALLVSVAVVFPDRNFQAGIAQASATGPTITALNVGPSIGSGTVQVAYTAGSLASPTNYEYSIDGGSTWVARSPASTASPLTISGLNNCSSYSIALRAVNSSSQSASSTAWTTMPRAFNYVFRNGLMRFGNGSQSSVNATNGNLEQPFYSFDSGSSWRQLTFSTRALESAIGVGGTGTSEWNISPTIAENSTLRNPSDTAASPSSSLYIDCSEFTELSTSGSGASALNIGYGALTVFGRVTIGGVPLAITRRYSLGSSDRFLTVRETVTNRDTSTASNVRMWTGTGDDYVGGSDSPTKTRGNIVNGSFVQNASTGLRAKAIQVNSGTESVYFYTTSNIGDMTHNNCCQFSNAYNQDPRTNATTAGPADGSYALYLRFQDLAPSGSESFTWYYAAGRTADLGSVLAGLDSAAKPGAPTSLVITPGNRQLSVAFTPGSSGGSSITNYEYSTDGGSTWVARSPGATNSPLMITGLTNGTPYSVRLRAVNSEGSGTASSAVSATPLGTPEAPTINSVTPGETSIDLDFTAGANGGSAVSGYEVTIDGESSWSSAAVTGSTVTISGLSRGTTYAVALRAVNAQGSGASSTQQSVRTGSVPQAPTISSITAADETLSVFFAEGPNGGSPTTNVEYSLNGGSAWVTRSPGSTASPLVISNLANGTAYSVKMRAVNTVGDGDASAATSATPRTTPAAPTIAGVTTPTSGSLTFTITPSTSGGSTITNYQYSTDRGATWRTRQDGETTSTTLEVTTLSADGSTQLSNGTEYCVQIRAVNAVGSGVASADVCSTPRTTPSAPSVSSSDSRDRSAYLEFELGANGGSPITSVEYSTDGSLTWQSAGSTRSPLLIVGLTNGTTYSVRLRAVNSEGVGAATSAVTIVPVTRATAPTLGSVTASDGQVSVTFGAPGSNGGSTISNYEYSLDGGASWTLRSPSSTTSPLVISGLTNGTNYGISMRAITDAGAGSASTVLYGLPVAAPSAPTGVSVTVASQRLSVSFTAPSSNGSPITNYEYSTNGGTSWTSAATTATTFDITGLTNGTTYSVRVRAINAIGTGPATDALSRTPAAVPGSPIVSTIDNTATLASVATTALSVSFTAGANNGAEISNYEYATSTDAGVTFGSWITRSPASSFSPLVIGSLTAGVTYHVRIRAVNANGSGQSSEVSSATSGGAAATVTITYNSQGGSAITNGTTTVGGQIASSPGTPTRGGYSFAGWFTAASGGSALSFPYTHNQSADFTLHAQWSANAYSVTYDGNGNTSGSIPAPASATFGSSFTTSTNSGGLARSGFSFVGWNSAANGTGTDFTAGASAAWSLAANTTLYAKWNDVDAPTASVTTARIRNSESATVESTETGTAYLVNTSITVTNLVSITSAANSVWNQVTISAVSTPTLLSATGLVDGTYKVYAADSANNVSAASVGTVTIDSTAPELTLGVSSTTSSTSSISFTLSGNENIDCTTIEMTPGVDFDLTGISAITSIVQTTATVCTVNANSTATAGGGAVVSTLTAAGSFSVADIAGNAKTSLAGSPQLITVTIPAPAAVTTTTTSVPVTTSSTVAPVAVTTTTLRPRRTTTTTTTMRRVVTTSTTLRPRRTTTTTTTLRRVVTTSTTLRPLVTTSTTSTTLRPLVTTTLRPVVATTTLRATTTTAPTTTTIARRVIVEVVPVATTLPQSEPATTALAAPATTLPLTRQVTTQQIQQVIDERPSNVQDLSLPVYVNSALPNPEPENPLVIQTSGDKVLDIITVNEQVVQMQDTQGFRLSVSATDIDGNFTKVNARGAIVVSRRNFITITGEGFLPNSDAVAWLFSQPRRLGVVRVKADGTFEESLQIADDVPMGDHTTQINGLTPEGEVRSLNLAVEVVDSVVSVTDTTIDPVLIAATGPRNDTAWWIGVLVLVAISAAGFGIIIGMRRRRQDDDSPVR